MKHTKGPWKLFVSNDARPHSVFLSIDVGSIAINHYGFADKNGVISSQQFANAHLIAAAPELLEALKDALCALECCDKDYPAATKARAAIAKATGETK